MAELNRWMTRLGAFVILVSPLLPQFSLGVRPASAFVVLAEPMPALTRLGLAAWIFAPLAAGAVLLAGTWGRKPPGPAIRSVTMAILMGVAFGLSTAGSLLLSSPGGGPGAPTTSFPVALLLFLLPILLAGTALARLVGGDFQRSSGGFARLSLGLLVALDAVYLLDGGWGVLLTSGAAQNGTFVPLAGGLLVAAGELLSRLPPRAAVDSAPASG